MLSPLPEKAKLLSKGLIMGDSLLTEGTARAFQEAISMCDMIMQMDDLFGKDRSLFECNSII